MTKKTLEFSIIICMMLADNKFTAHCSVTSSPLGLYDKLVLVSLKAFVRLLTFLSQCHVVGGVSEVRTYVRSLTHSSHGTFETVFLRCNVELETLPSLFTLD